MSKAEDPQIILSDNLLEIVAEKNGNGRAGLRPRHDYVSRQLLKNMAGT